MDEDKMVGEELDRLNIHLKAIEAPWRCTVEEDGQHWYLISSGIDEQGKQLYLKSNRYSQRGIIIYMRLCTVGMGGSYVGSVTY